MYTQDHRWAHIAVASRTNEQGSKVYFGTIGDATVQVDIKPDPHNVAAQVCRQLADDLSKAELLQFWQRVYASAKREHPRRGQRALYLGHTQLGGEITNTLEYCRQTMDRYNGGPLYKAASMSVMATMEELPLELPTVDITLANLGTRSFNVICTNKRHKLQVDTNLNLILVNHPTPEDEVRALGYEALSGKSCKCLDVKWAWETARRGLSFDTAMPKAMRQLRYIAKLSAEVVHT